MPFRKRKTKKPVSKSVVKYVKKEIQKQNVLIPELPRQMGGFPSSKRVTLTFNEHVYIATPVVSPGLVVRQWSCNSLYSPNVTSGGTAKQPYHFDQLLGATLYNRYIVTDFRYNVTLTNAAGPALVSAMVRHDQQYPTSVYTLWDLTHMRQLNANANPINKVVLQSKWMPLNKIMSRDLDVGSDGAVYSTSPTSVPSLTVFVQDPYTTTAIACSYLVKLEYKCTLYKMDDTPYSS